MHVAVLKRDNDQKYMWKMLFRNRWFACDGHIMPYIRENFGYKLGNEFLILYDASEARRVKIVQDGIIPEWGNV